MDFAAAVLRSVGSPLRVETLHTLEMADTDVVVRVRAASLCHTDLEAIDGQLAVPLPLVPGHEAAGVVDWVGPAVRSVRAGDHVVMSWNPHCGSCFYCRHEQPILCEPYRQGAAQAWHFDGRARIATPAQLVHTLMYTGGFAELVVVPESSAVKVPREIPFDRACLIGCGVMTGVGAVLNVAHVKAGTSVAVIGCGAVGLSAIQGARMAGAGLLMAIDRDPQKLELARSMGATHACLAGAAAEEEIRTLTDGRGVDTVFEGAGSPAAFESSLRIARPGGQVVWLGKRPVDELLALRWGSLTGEKRIVRSSYGGARPERDFPMLAQAYLDGRLHLDDYITSRIRLDALNDAVARLRDGREIRAVVEF